MIDHRPIAHRALLTLLFIAVLSFGNKVTAQDGGTLFKNNCASCHGVTKALTGPALAGLESRGPWSDRKKLYQWVHNPPDFMKSDKYTSDLKAQYGNIPMTPFPQLSEKDIDAIVDYINKTAAATAAGGAGGAGGTAAPGDKVLNEDDNSILYGVLTIILAIIALVMLQVNSNLKKLTDDKEGVPAREPIPFYRNKTYITLLTLILFVIGGFYLVKGAIGLGRSKDYQPEQPVYYSHKVHAGANQISCLYCHGGAMEGKHANIPSVNVCMNCHMTINEYTGGDLYREDGSKVNGTEEIKKIYAAAGWDPSKKQYTGTGKEIAWIKIHNLPDHVYFNHSQHVKAGKVQCQTCHGEITNMDEVKQFAELSMGWCVNCHRTTKIDFNNSSGEGNKFYSIYEKYHEEIKNHKRDSVTVNDIGGLECQKCHY
jgi:mono/diheme cytochrome c family protein